MRVMIFAMANKASETDPRPAEEMREAMAAMGKFNKELLDAGVLVMSEGLDAAKSKRVTLDGASRIVVDGPYAETREMVAGFQIWEVKDMAEALDWVRRFPNPNKEPTNIEIRPFMTMEQLAPLMSEEHAARKAALSARA